MNSKLLFAFLLSSQLLSAQNFTLVADAPFLGVLKSSVAFSDVDGDGDQDVLITGQYSVFSMTVPSAKLYINDGAGNYEEVIGTPFTGVQTGSISFSDIDGDGDQDVLLTGGYGDFTGTAKLYANDGLGNFTLQTGTPFTGVRFSSSAFFDVDSDGDQDLFISGKVSGSSNMSKLYINDGLGNFTELGGTPFEAVNSSCVAFSDVDGDDDLDILISGFNTSFDPVTKLYTNDGLGAYTESTGTPFESVGNGAVGFSDIDGDGDQDVLITGSLSGNLVSSKLYTNDGSGEFTVMEGTPFFNSYEGSISFVDIDGDNDDDLLLTGTTNGVLGNSALYINDGMGNFTLMLNPFVSVFDGDAAFADIDGDNDLDVLITGEGASNGDGYSKLYTNNESISALQEAAGASAPNFQLYPNPIVQDLNISYDAKVNQVLTLSVFDLSGRLILQQQEKSVIGQQTYTMNLSTLAKGGYIFQLDDGRTKVRQMIIAE